jgi:hypothetical protein
MFMQIDRRRIAFGAAAVLVAAAVVLAASSSGGRVSESGNEGPPDDSAVPGVASSPSPDNAHSGLSIANVSLSVDNVRRNAGTPRIDAVPPEYRVRNLVAEYKELAALARDGDVNAARALLDTTVECQIAPRGILDLEKLQARLDDPGNTRYASMDAESRQSIYDEHLELYRRCLNISQVALDSFPEWALIVAESGDREARVNYAMLGKPRDLADPDVQKKNVEFIERAKGYLNEEIARGNAEALMTMAVAYMPPVFSGHYTPFVIDPAEAYKYYYAFGQTEDGRSVYADTVAGNLAKLEEKLSEDQIRFAREEGSKIYEMCCARR